MSTAPTRPPRLRPAGPDDADTVARLHADSWRRHYRGAYTDAFLDGDVVADRRSVWAARLAAPGHSLTVLAESGAGSGAGSEALGFVHVAFNKDACWGSLVDNLHVTHDRRRTGIGTALLVRAAGSVTERAAGGAMYLWVLEQNTAAQAFYRALGGVIVETAAVPPPGGVPARLNGSPLGHRVVWPDVRSLTARPAAFPELQAGVGPGVGDGGVGLVQGCGPGEDAAGADLGQPGVG